MLKNVEGVHGQRKVGNRCFRRTQSRIDNLRPGQSAWHMLSENRPP